jgi:hypothetical protein
MALLLFSQTLLCARSQANLESDNATRESTGLEKTIVTGVGIAGSTAFIFVCGWFLQVYIRALWMPVDESWGAEEEKEMVEAGGVSSGGSSGSDRKSSGSGEGYVVGVSMLYTAAAIIFTMASPSLCLMYVRERSERNAGVARLSAALLSAGR